MPEITAPNAQAYGTYEQALGQMLTGGGQVAGPLNALALNGYARQQRGQYDLALQRTQALQAQQAQAALEAENQRAALVAAGAAGNEGYTGYIAPALSQMGLNVNNTAGAARDTLDTQDVMADVFSNRSTGLGVREVNGFGIPAASMNEALTPTNPLLPVAEFGDYLTPNAEAGFINAGSNQLNAETNARRVAIDEQYPFRNSQGSVTRTVPRRVPILDANNNPILDANGNPLTRLIEDKITEGMQSGGEAPSQEPPTPPPSTRLTPEQLAQQVRENAAKFRQRQQAQ